MKKRVVIFVTLVVVTIVVLRMYVFHFMIKADAIYPYNISVNHNKIEFDVTLNEGFYGIVDYSYEIKENCMEIVFYGSYYVNNKQALYANHVSIVSNEEIDRILIRSKHKAVTIWKK